MIRRAPKTKVSPASELQGIEVRGSNEVKDWIAEQDAIRPFGVGLPIPQRLVLELEDYGFEGVAMSQIRPHPVFVIKGRAGSTRCSSEADLRRLFRGLGRLIGFNFRAADTALAYSRGRFQVALCL